MRANYQIRFLGPINTAEFAQSHDDGVGSALQQVANELVKFMHFLSWCCGWVLENGSASSLGKLGELRTHDFRSTG